MSILSTILEEVLIVVAALWLLPMLNIWLPLWLLVLVMLAWAGYSVFTHRMGSRALKNPEPSGLLNMVGCRGNALVPLRPSGMVRVNGEIWAAESKSGDIGEGCRIIVVEQDRMKLIVRAAD